MKKHLILIGSAAALLTLSACNFNISGDGTWEITSDDKESAIAFYEGYIVSTLEHGNMVATIQINDSQAYVENIVDNKEHKKFDDHDEYYCVIDSKYYCAFTNGEIKQYIESTEDYDLRYRQYKDYLASYDSIQEESATYYYEQVGTSIFDMEKELSNETVNFTITGETAKVEIMISAQNGLITSFSSTYTQNPVESEDRVVETTRIEFTYGNAVVEIPDFSDWENAIK